MSLSDIFSAQGRSQMTGEGGGLDPHMVSHCLLDILGAQGRNLVTRARGGWADTLRVRDSLSDILS